MRKRNIIIDLTSLLDVILILFFAVMIRTRETTVRGLERAEEALQAAQEERDAARAQAEELSRLLHTEDLLLDNNLIITLSVGREESFLLETEGTDPIRIPYSWAENGYSYQQIQNAFRLLLSDFRERAGSSGARGDFGVFVVFQYDSGKIRRGQYEAIVSAVQRLKAENRGGLPLNYMELDVAGQETEGPADAGPRRPGRDNRGG